MGKDQSTDSLSIVIPCLRETETLEYCIKVAKKALQDYQIPGEVIVANNGGKDECYEIALKHADQVVLVEQMGYGSALMGGIEASNSKYVLFADADGSYDFGEAHKFFDKLKEGYDLVMGCRLASGGGTIQKGAMPFLHQYIGNPGFSILIQLMFGSPLKDPHCGLRAFKKDFYTSLNVNCPGMEYASEILIKASKKSKNITEIPITLYPDKRVNTVPHLNTFRDGWRHLKIYLKYWLGFETID